MNEITNLMQNLQVNQLPAQRKSLHLLNIPPEIRIKVYSYLFDSDLPIPVTVGHTQYLEQHLGIDCDDLLLTEPLELSTQVLRTCRQIFEEATVYLYGVNAFAILAQATWTFKSLNLSLGTRLCINKVRIAVTLGQQPDYSSISSQFPVLHALEVCVNGPGPELLLATYDISKVLVCSNVVPNEPRLELVARVPYTKSTLTLNEKALDIYDEHHGSITKASSEKFRALLRSKNGFKLVELDEFTKPLLGLGRQIPEFPVIRVHGELHPDHLQKIDEHECSFGDCSFEKISEMEVTNKGFQPVVYVWKKKDGEAAAIRGKDLSDAATVMRDFVPNLSQKFIDAMNEAGLDTQLLEKGQAIDRGKGKNKATSTSETLDAPQQAQGMNGLQSRLAAVAGTSGSAFVAGALSLPGTSKFAGKQLRERALLRLDALIRRNAALAENEINDAVPEQQEDAGGREVGEQLKALTSHQIGELEDDFDSEDPSALDSIFNQSGGSPAFSPTQSALFNSFAPTTIPSFLNESAPYFSNSTTPQQAVSAAPLQGPSSTNVLRSGSGDVGFGGGLWRRIDQVASAVERNPDLKDAIQATVSGHTLSPAQSFKLDSQR